MKRASLIVIPWILSLGLGIAISEFILRYLGTDSQFRSTSEGDTYVMSDEQLGWVLRPGTYLLQAPGAEHVDLKVRILPTGERWAGEYAEKGKEYWFFGGSFLFGQGLSDEDTVIYKLQSVYSDFHFRNFGVPGYGSSQSVVLANRKLKELGSAPFRVVYAFVDFHPRRNFENPTHIVVSGSDRNERRRIPVLDEDARVFYAPFRNRSSWNFFLLENSYLYERLVLGWESAQERRLSDEFSRKTFRFLKRTQKTFKERGLSFTVALFDSSKGFRKKYGEELTSLQAIDCSVESYPSEEMSLPYDPHPNELVQDHWQNCLSEKLFRQN